MAMNPLPPQAYTKETMLKAYQWLIGQNSSIKEMATTPDILVSLYLKATRDGSGALDRPSIQNFKNELRSLAGIMGELDRPQQNRQDSFEESAVKRTTQPTPPAPTPVAAPVSSQPQIATQPMVSPTPTAPTPAPVSAPAAVESAVAATPTVPAGPVHSQITPAVGQTPVLPTEKTLATTTQTSNALELLDLSSRCMIQEVKEDFNLSSDLEALRMLIKIGHSRAKALLR